MIRIGCVNIDVSHPEAFGSYLVKGDRARYTEVYNDGFRSDSEVEEFIKKLNLKKRCRTLEELAEITDIGFVHSCNWDKHLGYAMPFISRKKPVFIDKPLVGNFKDCKKLEELAKGGAVILGSSSVRYAPEIEEFLKIPVEERGEIVHVFGTSGVDEFNYAIHIIEAFGGLLGMGAVSGKFAGRTTSDIYPCDTYLIEYANGVNAVCALYQGAHRRFTLTILTTKNTYNLELSATYEPMLDKICTFMETGKNELASIPAQIEAIKVLLACKVSRFRGGEAVKLCDIPEDEPGYDGYEFEKGYAERATGKK